MVAAIAMRRFLGMGHLPCVGTTHSTWGIVGGHGANAPTVRLTSTEPDVRVAGQYLLRNFSIIGQAARQIGRGGGVGGASVPGDGESGAPHAGAERAGDPPLRCSRAL